MRYNPGGKREDSSKETIQSIDPPPSTHSPHLCFSFDIPHRWTLIDTHPPYGDFMVCRRKKRFLRPLRECVADRLTSKNLFGQFGHDFLLIIRVQRDSEGNFYLFKGGRIPSYLMRCIKHPERDSQWDRSIQGVLGHHNQPVSPLYSVFTPHCPLGERRAVVAEIEPK